MANEVWAEIYDRWRSWSRQHRTTLIFVNTRRLAERVAPAPRRAAGRGRR
jgi:ATP-dependent helicase Lhr and Lhr-like helicase